MLMLDAAGLAARAGIEAEESAAIAVAPAEEATAVETVSTLLFTDLSGARRGIRLGVVERLEDVAAEQIAFTAGRLRVAIDGRLLPLVGTVDRVEPGSLVKLLRLSDGVAEVAYPIGEVIDIVPLAPAVNVAGEAGPIAGVALVDGVQVELLDSFWLFSEAQTSAAPADARPLCAIADAEDRWSREILRPLLEAAGYRVAFGADPKQPADVIVADRDETVGAAAPVVRLRRELGTGPDGSVYRYDRAGLLAAIDARLKTRSA